MSQTLTSFQDLPDGQAFRTLFDDSTKIKVGNGYRHPNSQQVFTWRFQPAAFVDDLGLTGDDVESLSLLTNS